MYERAQVHYGLAQQRSVLSPSPTSLPGFNSSQLTHLLVSPDLLPLDLDLMKMTGNLLNLMAYLSSMIYVVASASSRRSIVRGERSILPVTSSWPVMPCPISATSKALRHRSQLVLSLLPTSLSPHRPLMARSLHPENQLRSVPVTRSPCPEASILLPLNNRHLMNLRRAGPHFLSPPQAPAAESIRHWARPHLYWISPSRRAHVRARRHVPRLPSSPPNLMPRLDQIKTLASGGYSSPGAVMPPSTLASSHSLPIVQSHFVPTRRTSLSAARNISMPPN